MAATITVNPAIGHQTITGWEVVDYAAQEQPGFPTFVRPVMDKLINEVGINRVRLEVRSGAENSVDYYTLWKGGSLSYSEWRCRRYSTVNDNDDPNDLNVAGFQFAELDEHIDQIVLPMRQRLQDRGEQLYINLNYVAFVTQMTESGCVPGLQYHHNTAPEYAEFILAVFTHMQQKYGFVPDAVEVILEPDNTPSWRGKAIGDAIVASAQKLQANGFAVPHFIAPSVTDMSAASPYFDDMLSQVPESLAYLAEISYHRYGGVSLGALQGIAGRALQFNLKTSMLEWWSDGNSYQVLHEDLKVGRNSAWQIGPIAGPGAVTDAIVVDYNNPSAPPQLGLLARYARLYFEYVRMGAQRVEAQSDSGSYDPLAFRNTDGKFVVVAIANAAGRFDIVGLPAGTYGVKYTSLTNAALHNINGPDTAIASGETLAVTLPYSAVVTVYAKSSAPPANQPPTVIAGADQTVTLPAPARLSGAANDDGLPNPPGQLTTTWTKVSFNGAGLGDVTFADQNALSTTVVFSDAGTYVLRLTADDSEYQRYSELTITVNNPTGAPTANDQSVTTTVDTPSGITLTGSDPDNRPLTFIVLSSPNNGFLTGTPPDLTYYPNAGFTGTDSFTFKVNNAMVDSNIATVSITVTAGPPEVSVTVSPALASLTQGQSQLFTAAATGSANTAVTWSLSPGVGSLMVNGNSVIYTAPAIVTEPQTVTITATSVADSTKLGTAEVTLEPPEL